MATSSTAWTEPGAYEVAPGVHRIPLPLPHDGLKAVNVYLLATAEGPVLIDAGWAITEARELLETGLAEAGTALPEIRRCLVTHAHRDHYTLGVQLRREFGTRIALGLGEKPSLDLLQDPAQLSLGTQLDRLPALGATALAEALTAFVGGHHIDPTEWEPPDAWLDEGVLTLEGGRELEAVATPGHTAGHLVFHDLAGRLLFAGDHVLPTITPSIGFEPVLSPDPLGDFLRSLAIVRARPDALLLPAHGPVADSVHARVDELVAHHGERLDEAEAAARDRSFTAFDVAGQLRWTRREHRLADLDPFHALLAVFETFAHLELLVAQGRLSRTTDGEVDRYR